MNWETLYWGSQLLLVVLAGVALISGAVVNKRQSKQLLTLETKLDEQRQKTDEQRERAAESETKLLALQNLINERRRIDEPLANEILAAGAKGTAKIAFAGNSEEAGKLALDLANLLIAHGWIVEEGISPTMTVPPMPIGVSFFVKGAYFPEPVLPDNLIEQGKTLYKLLSEAIVGNTMVGVQGSDMVPAGKVVINVGHKF